MNPVRKKCLKKKNISLDKKFEKEDFLTG